MRLAVTGYSGQVASALRARATEAIQVIPIARPQMDLGQLETIGPALIAAAPDIIVHCAAYTAVDKAETDPDIALAVNSTAAEHVAATAAKLNVPVVYLSTDYVFDGSSSVPYTENDPPSPINVYGATKLAGERAVAAACDEHVIVRCSWVYSPYGSNFVKTMLRLASERDEIAVVADQYGRPTAADDIASALLHIATTLDQDHRAELFGVFHLAPEGATTWAQFAEAIFKYSREFGGPSARVRPIGTEQYPTPARRPAHSILDGSKFARTYEMALPAWPAPLRECVQTLLNSEHNKQ